jgi:hypothetical protein
MSFDGDRIANADRPRHSSDIALGSTVAADSYDRETRPEPARMVATNQFNELPLSFV